MAGGTVADTDCSFESEKCLEPFVCGPVHACRCLQQNPAFLIRQTTEDTTGKLVRRFFVVRFVRQAIQVRKSIEHRPFCCGESMNACLLFDACLLGIRSVADGLILDAVKRLPSSQQKLFPDHGR